MSLHLEVLASAIHENGGTYAEAVQKAQEFLDLVDQVGLILSDPEPLPQSAPSRKGDPVPSVWAADSISDLPERHAAVLSVAQHFAGPWTYDEIVRRYAELHGGSSIFADAHPPQEPSSIRTRCKELRRAGWIERAGMGESDAGRPAQTWHVTFKAQVLADAA